MILTIYEAVLSTESLPLHRIVRTELHGQCFSYLTNDVTGNGIATLPLERLNDRSFLRRLLANRLKKVKKLWRVFCWTFLRVIKNFEFY